MAINILLKEPAKQSYFIDDKHKIKFNFNNKNIVNIIIFV